MDLKKRLAEFDRLTRRPATTTASAASAEGPPEEEICHRLGLQSVRTAAGLLWYRDYTVKRPGALAAPFPDLTSVFTQPAPLDLQPDELLFLDTETTGLAGGTGSLAFLVGVGWWTESGFTVRQYFLAGPGRETPILRSLETLARRFRVIVTFNGNGFDLPLLRTRALLVRLEDPCAHLVSWDLLPAVRRLWGRRLADCRQQTLEQEVCGRRRGIGDIESALIPQAYFQYLREGDAGQLPQVMRHNQRDMVGMALLLRSVVKRVRLLARPPGHGRIPVPWQDAWSNGRIWEVRGDKQLASAWLEDACQRSVKDKSERFRAACPEIFFRDAVRILKRTRSWSQLEEVIRVGLRSWGDRAWLHREAAILYEHRLDRLEVAWQHAQRSAEPVRMSRLARKLGRGRAGVI